MRIKKIEIENVKSFRDRVTIDFDNSFNVFIGSNGSGKSNLLDIITLSVKYFFLNTYTIQDNAGMGAGISTKRINKNQSDSLRKELEKYFGNENEEMFLKFSFQLSQTDIDNIRNIKTSFEKLKEIEAKEYSNSNILQNFNIQNWNPDAFQNEEIIEVEISDYQIAGYYIMGLPVNNLPNSAIQISEKNRVLMQYLNSYELALILNSTEKLFTLSPNFLFFSPYRGTTDNQTLQASLSSQTYNQALQQVHTAHSKKNTSLINIASIYFAEKRRNFEDKASQVGYEELWNSDSEVMLMTKYLKRLGYGWDLKSIDTRKNIYEIQLQKDEQTLLLSQASSGEKEIINYLLGIFALNITDGIIIIDEPELHLHPKWQNLLLELFYEVSEITNNQFFISTHSANFINPKTLKNIIRVYKREKTSKTVLFDDSLNIKVKDLLHIVNSTNNEKLFFSDAVILVEGITDRMIFQKIVNDKIEQQKLLLVIEVIDIGGKHNKEKFTAFLDMFKIPNFFIADLDYVNEVGNADVKDLFKVDKPKVDKFAIKNSSSKDASTLIDKLDNAILSGSTDELKKFVDYIKSFRRTLKDGLNNTEIEILDKFIDSQKADDIFILKKGDIENYFPEKFQKKDLENVLELLKEENFSLWEKDEEFGSLSDIIEEIIEKAIL